MKMREMSAYAIRCGLLAAACVSAPLFAIAAPPPKPSPKPWVQEPTSYRGVSWGTPLEAAKTAADIHSCHCEDEAWNRTDCTAEVIPPVRGCLGGLLIGNMALEETWLFAADRFSGVDLRFDASSYDQLRDIFIERYGPPTTTRDDTFENRMGAKVPNPMLVWGGKTVVITLSKYADTLNKGHGEVMTQAFITEHAAAKERAAKEGAKIF